MPKRKSEQSVDEWLGDGLVTAETNRMLVETSRGERGSHSEPTAEAIQQTVAAEPRTEVGHLELRPGHVAKWIAEVATEDRPPTEVEVATEVAGTVGDVAVTPEEAVEWFWGLLARAGYEIW